jgi:hypothetical protein
MVGFRKRWNYYFNYYHDNRKLSSPESGIGKSGNFSTQ